MRDFDAVLIAGATASGKSAFALALEKSLAMHGRRAVLVNVDSMQVYEDLRIVSARPSMEEEQQAEHLLYGVFKGDKVFSTRDWLDEVETVLARVMGEGRVPLLVGGTGLYFKALTEGLAHVPPIEDAVREAVRDELEAHGSAVLHEELCGIDAVSAAQIKAGDKQRICRALEVYRGTGRALSDWTSEAHEETVLDGRPLAKVILMPEREWLYERINRRFEMMVDEGALDEIEALLKCEYAEDAQVMKAIGVPQLVSYLRDEMPLEEAIALASQESRRYAKRQMTWFRNQMGDDWVRLDPSMLSLDEMCKRVLG